MKKNLSKQPAYSALDIAKYFVAKARSQNKPLTNKKIQKLLYYAQAWSVTLLDKKLFDEKIEAWVHGPAIRTIYDTFAQFGAKDFSEKFDISSFSETTIEDRDRQLLDVIWTTYGKREADYLETLSHSEDPWLNARDGLEPNQPSSNEITTQSMKKFYGQKVK